MKQSTTAEAPPETRKAPPQEAGGEVTVDGSNQDRLEALGDCGYTVREGDTLWDIAEARIGDGMGWLDLYSNNDTVVGENPDLILPDQVLDLCGQTLEVGEHDDVVAEAAKE